MKTISGNKIKLLPYQKKIIDKISPSNDYILSGPTSSGKTIMAYAFSGILYPEEFNSEFHRVLICSPIKALSNERYLELRHAGFDVGIETGDIKYNSGARILCVTQEIYLLKYCHIKKCRVIIDEVHYLFSDEERAKSYMDSICRTSKASNILLLSATIHSPDKFKDHINSLTGRKFELISWTDRPVPLEFDKNGFDLKKIKESIIFAFSVKNINFLIEKLLFHRGKSASNLKSINEVSYKWNCNVKPEWTRGIAGYHGRLLPKEKHCIEEIFRNGDIDIIVGTDALALGVNLPARNVLFSTFRKGAENHFINPSHFQQLAGRAGRYGYHDKGTVSYIKGMIDKSDFVDMTKKKLEKMFVRTQCDIASILKGREIEEELAEVENYYHPVDENNNFQQIDYKNIETERIYKIFDEIQEMIKNNSHLYKSLLFNCYCSEFTLDENFDTIELCEKTILNGELDVHTFIDFSIDQLQKLHLEEKDGRALRNFLILRKFIRSLSEVEGLKIKNSDYIDWYIDSIDHTILSLGE